MIQRQSAATYFYVTIQNKHVVVKYDGTKGNKKVTRRVEDPQDFTQFIVSKANEAGCEVSDLILMCSSSIDFPHDYNVGPDVVALCNFIRGNDVPLTPEGDNQ